MPAIWWVGEPGDSRIIGRAEVEDAAGRLAEVLSTASSVAIDLPPLPELVVALMACERAGIAPQLFHPLDTPHITECDVVLTSSAFVYRGELVFLKERIDESLAGNEQTRVVVHDRTGWMPLGATMDVYHDVPMHRGRDVWFRDVAGEIVETDEHPANLVEAPSVRAMVEDPSLGLPGTGRTLFLFEGYLEPEDADRARAAYVGASGTSLGSRPEGRLS